MDAVTETAWNDSSTRREDGPFYQNMKTSDALVLEIVKQREVDYREFTERAEAWAVEIGGEGAVPAISNSMGRCSVSGLIAAEKPEGRWRALNKVRGIPEGLRAFAPYVNTRPHRSMDALTLDTIRVPGMPVHFDLSGGAGQMYWLTPQIFAHEGVVYMCLSSSPDREQSDVRGHADWVECLTSEVDAAREARNANA